MARGSSSSFGQAVLSFILAILFIAILGCAGYGVYSLIDNYANQEQAEQIEEIEGDNITAEELVANQACAELF